MSQVKKSILVTGATGKQGGAVINALLEAGALNTHTIVAITRNPESASAKKLTDRGVTVIKGDLNDVPAVFRNAKEALNGQDIWGVYSVQLAVGSGTNVKTEEAQGKALVDGALANNVKFFVYSAIERGGEARSWENPTESPMFISKHRVERHLVDSAKGKMEWAIIRPVAFMEGWKAGFEGKLLTTAWKVAAHGKPLQLVATQDIGYFAAKALLHPQDFAGRAVSLAGDELTLEEANKIVKDKTGAVMPETFHFLTRFLLWLVPELGKMFVFLDREGFGADVAALRKEHPGLLSFKDWVAQEPSWVKKSA